MKGLAANCAHQGDARRRYHRISWSGATVCDACLAAEAAANRVRTAHVGPVAWRHVHGTGMVAPKPTLEAYERYQSLVVD